MVGCAGGVNDGQWSRGATVIAVINQKDSELGAGFACLPGGLPSAKCLPFGSPLLVRTTHRGITAS